MMDNDNIPRASSRILFNPEFGKVHINPEILRPKPNGTIHVNPHFLAQLETSSLKERPCQGDIVTLSKTKLVRTPVTVHKSEVGSLSKASDALKPSEILKIGNRKLVRRSIISNVGRPAMKEAVVSPGRVEGNVYKVDRRVIVYKKMQHVGKSNVYTLRKNIGKQPLTVKKILAIGKNPYKVQRSCIVSYQPAKSNFVISRDRNSAKKKCLLNIDGVLYKSTKTKLEKESIVSPLSCTHWSSKMSRKVKNENGLRVKVNVGGQEYRTISSTFIPTNRYTVRNYLSAAKQKSISFLSRHLTKSNVPCPIFRKVGKCAAYERGRCPKVHDKKHVAVCPRYLKGECNMVKCFLSHDVNLSKMPTCKFYLQGCCTRAPCPYLHKKLNDNADICDDFLKGYCNLGGECIRRHEFLATEFDSKAQSKKTRQSLKYNKNNHVKSKEESCSADKIDRLKPLTNVLGKEQQSKNESESEIPNCSRYFQEALVVEKVVPVLKTDEFSESSGEIIESTSKMIIGKRPKLGDLPAFIPL